LADECLGLPTIGLLLAAGYPILKAKEAGLGGKPDFEILRYAIKSRRVLITEDIDFSNIILYPLRLHHGIILLRFRHKLEEAVHNTLLTLLKELKPKDFQKTLIIVDSDKYRLRKE